MRKLTFLMSFPTYYPCVGISGTSDYINVLATGLLACYGRAKIYECHSQADPKMVEELVEKISMLVKDEKLRKRMGRAGRQETEKDRFSVVIRNRKLKKIFDEAMEK